VFRGRGGRRGGGPETRQCRAGPAAQAVARYSPLFHRRPTTGAFARRFTPAAARTTRASHRCGGGGGGVRDFRFDKTPFGRRLLFFSLFF